MKFAIDRIIDDMVVLENISTGEVKNVNISKMPDNIKETDIVLFENDIYKLDINEKENRINLLKEKMNKLRGENNEYR